MNTCKSCKHSQEGQFGLFCSEPKAQYAINPVNGEKAFIDDGALGVSCATLRNDLFGACGPFGNLWADEYDGTKIT